MTSTNSNKIKAKATNYIEGFIDGCMNCNLERDLNSNFLYGTPLDPAEKNFILKYGDLIK